MALVHTGVDRLAQVASAAQPLRSTSPAPAPTPPARSAARPASAGSPWNGRGSPRTSPSIPPGSCTSSLQAPSGYRTDPLPPVRRSLVVTDLEAAGTPILLLHGIMDNRSVFTVFRRTLRRRGFGVVHAVNYSVFTGDIRTAAHRAARARRAAARARGRGQDPHRRPLARRDDRPLLRPADGRHGRRRHARHARQPARRHPGRLPAAHAAGPPAASGVGRGRRTRSARAVLRHAVPGRVEPAWTRWICLSATGGCVTRTSTSKSSNYVTSVTCRCRSTHERCTG